MAKLLFFDEGHVYKIGDDVLPSVSEITRFISREIYGTVGQYTLDNAADRGTRVHKACEILDKYGKVDVSEDIVPYIQAYIKFRKEHTVVWHKIEAAMYHPELRYAGTIDRGGEVDEVSAILDIKSTCKVEMAEWTAKLNLYKKLDDANGGNAVKLLVLHLKPTGDYKLIQIPIDTSTADACLTLHNALKKKARKKKNGKQPDCGK